MKKWGRYEPLERINSTETTESWKARDGEEIVLIKRLHRHLAQDSILGRHFRREAALARKLDHPGILKIYDLIEADESPALVSELIEGGPLTEEPFKLESALPLIRQILEALHYAHKRGVVHRNLKPENILLSKEGRIILTDFGSAHIRNILGLSTSTMFFGNPEYTAPETVISSLPDPKLDVYSLGALLYRWSTGQSHRPEGLEEFFTPTSKILHPSEINHELPRWFGDLLLQLLAPAPDRTSGAGELLGRLKNQRPTDTSKICLYCFRDISLEAPFCPYCGREDIEIRQLPEQEGISLMIDKITESVDAIHHVQMVLQALKNDRNFNPEFLIGDSRLYSREEKARRIPFPVRILDNLDEDSANRLIEAFDPSSKKSPIQLTKRPSIKVLKKSRKKQETWEKENKRKKIPGKRSHDLLIPKLPLRPRSSATATAFYRKMETSDIRNSSKEDRRVKDETFLLYRSLEQLEPERAEEMGNRLEAIYRQYSEWGKEVERQVSLLNSVQTGEIFSRLQQCEKQLKKADSAEETGEWIKRKQEVETLYRRVEEARSRYTRLQTRREEFHQQLTKHIRELSDQRENTDRTLLSSIEDLQNFLKE